MRRLGVALAVAAASAVAAAPAAAGTVSATRGQVSATVTYQGSGIGTRNDHLQISRGGQSVYDQPVSAPSCGHNCDVLGLRVLPLQAGSEPQVLLRLFWGGANCCEVDEVFSWAPAAGTYDRATRVMGEGARVRDLAHNGRYEFETADYAFKYAFTDGAASGQPIQILRFSAGRFLNVTRSYPKLIARDAAAYLKAFKAQRPHYSDTVGLIAAWAADEDELGHSRQVARYLRRQAALGHLNSALDPKERGQRFLRDLNRFLRRGGYLR
jgi:hypothetical protein